MSMQRSGGVNFNLFAWIREGVKQSILLGVSDAVETIGTPNDADEINPQFLEFLRSGNVNESDKVSTAAPTAKRKRLGRSLKDLESEGGV